MSNVRGRGQSPQRGYHTREQINTTMPESKARDDIMGAFAGEENEAKHSTKHKSRKLPSDAKDREPKR